MIELSKRQLEAVQSIQYPTLVVAVPGAGKTRVIVEKYLYLYSLGFSLERLVAITYTNKAADEMLDRLKSKISKFIDNPYISTIHSFALRLMIENKDLFNFRKGSTIIDPDDSKEIIEDIIVKNNLNLINVEETYKFINNSKETFDQDIILFCYDDAHQLLIDNHDIKKIKLNNHKDIKFNLKIKAFKLYQQYLFKSNIYDYSDLIIYPLLTLKYNKKTKEIINMMFDYILVDEYQDINNLQNQFLILISNGANITAVGDEDQSIYGFRGASIEPILNFEYNFPNAKIIYLYENYRSKKKIIDCANLVISKNTKRRDKKTIAVNEEEGKVELRFFETEYQMVDYIIYILQNLIKNGIDLENIAILVRAAWLLIKIQKRLMETGIPYNMLRGINFFERKEIKYAIFYVSFKLNLNSEFLLKKISSYPKRGIGSKTLEKIIEKKEKNNKDFLEILLDFENDKVKSFGNFLLKLFNISNLSNFLVTLRDEGGFIEEWEKEGEDIYLDRKENYDILINLASKIEDEYKDKTEDVFQVFLSKVIPYSKENQPNGVILGTLHSAKGLEFEAVILPYVSETILPYKRYNEEANIEEERRLLYVGMTRAKEFLYIFHSNSIEFREANLGFSILIEPLIKDYLKEDKVNNSRFSIGDYIESDIGVGKIIDIKKLRNGKFVYIIENSDGIMQLIEGIHKITKKDYDY